MKIKEKVIKYAELDMNELSFIVDCLKYFRHRVTKHKCGASFLNRERLEKMLKEMEFVILDDKLDNILK